MSDPLTDMSLAPPNGAPMTIWPLEPVPLQHLPLAWTRQIRRRARGQTELWQATRPVVRLMLPGLPLLPAEGPCWRSWPETAVAAGMIELYLGFVYDGASGPAVDDQEALLASAVHDVCVKRIDGVRVRAVGWVPRGYPQVCPSYAARAMIYPAILRAQGETLTRAAYSLAAVGAYDAFVEPFVWRRAAA